MKSLRTSFVGRRKASGMSAWEVLLASFLGVGILTGGIALTASTTEVAASSASDDAASRHVERVMRAMVDAIRGSSLGQMKHGDGVTAFADGDTDTGLTVRKVLGFGGGVTLDSAITYRLEIPAGAAKGELLRSQDGVDQVVARGITSLSITRDDDSFTISVSAHTGPEDHRGRNARGSVTVRTRNP